MVPSANVGYPALALLVGGESLGLILPGETAILAAGALARDGHLQIALVITIAAVAAIVGDNIGYLLGRRGERERIGDFWHEPHAKREVDQGVGNR